jgi:carbamoyl-phosphate synthase small subunit
MQSKLILSDDSYHEGVSFGASFSASGEVVFATGMTGYPQAFTDPSFAGQILVMTYPLIGNYGIPSAELWESEKIKIAGLIVSNYIDTPSHYQSKITLSQWLKKAKIPALEIKDTRLIAQQLREKGTMLGKIVIDKDIPLDDPNDKNLVAKVSTKKIQTFYPENKSLGKTILMIDCGAKKNIQQCFLKRGATVIRVPWDYDPFVEIPPTPFIKGEIKFDALFISNGPGDPKKVAKTIQTIKKALAMKIPTLGICLGNQLLALAAGGDTVKLKYGHRSQNQPCIMKDTKRCFITTQNHGFAIKTLPDGFEPWFLNANDQTIEGIKHTKYPFMSVQFHPEAAPGPMDTEWIFDYFLEKI